MRCCVRGVLASLLVVLVSHSTVSGALVFDLEWGPVVPGTASAVGVLTVDETLLPNPSSGPITPFVLDFEMTVSGATSGNGTFFLPDFSVILWHTGGLPLDLTAELVGQPTVGDPWGTSTAGTAGDFSFLATPLSGAPTVGGFFVAITHEGAGSRLLLTSFRPGAIPAPGAILLGSIGVGVVGWLRRRKTL